MSSGGGDDGSPPSLSGFRYGIGVSAAVLALIITITLLSYFCTRPTTSSSPSTPTRPPPPSVAITVSGGEDRPRRSSGDHSPSSSRGLNDAALRNFPKLLYSQAKLHSFENDRNNNNCSICLCEYVDTDVIRLLPECGHVFHLGCVDSWLRQSATCPICRSSPIPSPLVTTPLADPG